MTDLGIADEVSTGETLDGRYRLLARIGEGGMARVYLAEDIALGRRVAVKVLRGEVGAVATAERAKSETALLASLNHHALVTLFDARVSDSEAGYLVMEYVEGITMRDLVARGPVEAAELATIAVDLAEGLHVAHESGVVHRDIKPSNVLLRPSPVPGHAWRAKLADFGIAYLCDSARVTTPGLVVGTTAYIAPEQARGGTPAPPADIYAFGILLIEALTGTRPFAEAEGIGALTARLMSPPPIPDSVPAAWQGLLRGMTAMDPADRPTALEVAVAARRATGTDAAARPPAVDEQTSAMPGSGVIAASSGAGRTATMHSASPDTGPTAVIPPFSAAEASARVDHRTVDADEPTDPPSRHRGVLIALAAGALALAVLLAGGFWLMGLTGATPDPGVTTPAVEPSVGPTEDVVEEEPATVDDSETGGGEGTVEDGDSGDGVSTEDGSGNSGPGNNNGNGNGNGGNGNGGNGNGNGNSGPGNNNGGGNGRGND